MQPKNALALQVSNFIYQLFHFGLSKMRARKKSENGEKGDNGEDGTDGEKKID